MKLFKKEKSERLLSPMLVAPVVLMALVAVAMLVMAVGRTSRMDTRKVSFLDTPPQELKFNGESQDGTYLLLYNGGDSESIKLKDITADMLSDMRLKYRFADITKEMITYREGDTVMLCTGSIQLLGDQFETFAKWIAEHDLIWLCMPEYTEQFVAIYRSLGISYCLGNYYDGVNGMAFLDDFIHGLEGMSYPDLDMNDVSMAVTLESETKQHITDTKYRIPLVWTYRRVNGSTAVIFNTNVLMERNNFTGMITAALAETKDVLVWPVINAMTIFIDDFPAPQPEGYDERIKAQFGYTTKSFWMNIWWPDMKKLQKKYDLAYTGVLIEDYNDKTVPPFTAGTADTVIKYYGAELLSNGGEIALHGYNHQPLIMEGTKTLDNYAGWPNTENMSLAIGELVRYAKLVFPEVTFTSYVPPSNNLSQQGIGVLRQKVPTLKVLSGVYYDEEGGTGYMTDFEEMENGLINFPRISSEFHMDAYNEVRLFCMLYSKGVFSHFIHPDDVLDVERGADLGWNVMRDGFDSVLGRVRENYSIIRGLTASSGGGAAQRFNRVRYQTESKEDKLLIHLQPFEDEVWLAIDSDKKPGAVSGGSLTDLGGGLYWLCCTQQEVQIDWAGGTP